MTRIAVLTSGGDAPGMNAAVRAVVRTACAQRWEVLGVRQGYAGLIEGACVPLNARDVAGILQRGGTVLGTARCEAFATPAGRATASAVLSRHAVDGVIVIGGNGSQCGAHALAEAGIPVVGVASTIDNDLCGSDICIGVDTALNVALEAIDRLKTTAASHRRAFLVEVMGRGSGYLALMSALAGGAEVAVIPEDDIDPDDLARRLRAAYESGKSHAIAVVAEGARQNAAALAAHFRAHADDTGFDVRVTTLGHVQRGGVPSAFDRLLATRLGAAAVDAFVGGQHDVLIGWRAGAPAPTPLADVVGRRPALDPALVQLADVLARSGA